jgi:hypothetical protein
MINRDDNGSRGDFTNCMSCSPGRPEPMTLCTAQRVDATLALSRFEAIVEQALWTPQAET